MSEQERVFERFVDEALEYVKRISSKEEALDEDLERYVQRHLLRADDYDSFVVLQGKTRNQSRVHFGNVSAGMYSLIKKRRIKGKVVPLLSDNALRGMVNHQLRVLSKKLGIGDPKCGLFDEKGQRFDCGKCLRCGIMGFLNPNTGENVVHKLAIRSFLTTSAEIITEYHNSPDAVKGTIFAPREVERERKERAAVLYVTEYIAPGGEFPLQIVFRGMAPGEMGVALMQMGLAWHYLGLGRHKNGSFTTWTQNPEDWTLTYIPIEGGEIKQEVYTYKSGLVNIINTLKNIAYIAMQKKLFREYEAYKPERPSAKERSRK
ncbi:hypothetical protein DRO64_10370 [Candidatus Bathyarchaeota archaeon]|nr:MAG: hypothetical protein DRO64_10370 [Candidatus Bathyarchaeota archaeon]